MRQAAVQELARGWKDDPDTLPILKERPSAGGSKNTVRQAAIQELARGWRHDPDTLPYLTQSARESEDWAVQIAAIEELARGWRTIPTPWRF